MDMEKIYRKALALDFLTADEALVLYESGPLDELMSLAWELRQKHVPGRTVTWQIDRNVNITNVCISGCKFCNFHVLHTLLNKLLQKFQVVLLIPKIILS